MEQSSDEDEDDSEETLATSVPSSNGGTDSKIRPGTAATVSGSGTARTLSPSTQLSPLPPGASSYGEQHASLIALLDNARSFVGSLKTVHQPRPSSAGSRSGSGSLATSVREAYSATASERYYGSSRLNGAGITLPQHADMLGPAGRDSNGVVSPEVAASLREQSQKFRDMLAMDLPSHRGRSSRRNKKTVASLLRDGEAAADGEGSAYENITEEEMDRLAPLSNLATSLPINIGFTQPGAGLPPGAYGSGARRLNGRRQDIEFEQKTSVPTGEGMFVPRYKRDKRPDGTHANTVGGLAVLGEEQEQENPDSAPVPALTGSSSSPVPARDGRAEPIPGVAEARRAALDRVEESTDMAQGSPPTEVVSKPSSTTAAQDAGVELANRAEEEDDVLGREVQAIRAQGGFVPPHVGDLRLRAIETWQGRR